MHTGRCRVPPQRARSKMKQLQEELRQQEMTVADLRRMPQDDDLHCGQATRARLLREKLRFLKPTEDALGKPSKKAKVRRRGFAARSGSQDEGALGVRRRRSWPLRSRRFERLRQEDVAAGHRVQFAARQLDKQQQSQCRCLQWSGQRGFAAPCRQICGQFPQNNPSQAIWVTR